MRIPTYRKHSSGQARVTLQGKDHMLGPYGSQESKEAYARLIAEYLAAGIPTGSAKAKGQIKMEDVLLAYIRHARTHYAGSTEFVNMKAVVQGLADLYASLPASRFGAAEFKAVRAHWMLDKRRSRQHVNKQMKRTLRVIKWAVAAGMMQPEAHHACTCVQPLQKGRCGEMREAKRITCVASQLVEKTLPCLTRVLQDMVKLQQATGASPGEICKIKPGMVDRSGDVWTIDFGDDHKTAHKGRARVLYLGPVAQSILQPYLLRAHDVHCFSPQESEKQRLAARHAARRTPLTQGNSPGTNRIARKPRKAPGQSYTSDAYANAIQYACRRAKLPHRVP